MDKRIALISSTSTVALAASIGPVAHDVAHASDAGRAVTSAHALTRPEALALATRFYRPFTTGRTADHGTVLSKGWVDRPLAAGQAPGRAGFAPVVAYFRSVFPDLRVRIVSGHVSQDGRYVTVRTVYTGTQEAAFLGVPATHAAISFRTTDVHRIAGRRIVETWHLEDTYGAQQQMLAAR